MSRTVPKHETRALLRAHLAAAVGRGHLTPRCAVCRRLLRLAMEAAGDTPAGLDGRRADC